MNEVWGILDVLTYLDNRIKKLEAVTEAYAMAGIDYEKYKPDLFAIGELHMLKNEIMEHLESEEH